MWMRLRQIAVVTEDLRRSALDIGTVLGVEACHVDPGVGRFGLKNTLWPIGTQFIEVVTPFQEGTAGGRYMDRRGGDSGYMFICQVDDVDHRRQRAEELGIRTAFEQQAPAGALAVMKQATEALRQSGILERMPQIGDALPAFALPDSEGNELRSDDVAVSGPLVLTFYRGVW